MHWRFFSMGRFEIAFFLGCYLEKKRHGKKQKCSVFSSAALDPFRSEDSCLDSWFLWYLCRCSTVRSLNIISFLMLLHTEETVCFRNEINTLKATLSARSFISRLSCCWVRGGNAACVKESPLEDKNTAGLLRLTLRHYAFFFVRTYQFVSGKKVGEERSFSKRAQGTSHSRLGGCRTLICLLWHRQRTVDELWPLSTQQAFVSECERDLNLVSVTIWTFAFIRSPEIWPSMIHII